MSPNKYPDVRQGKQTKTGQQSQKEISSTAVELNASMCHMLLGLNPCLLKTAAAARSRVSLYAELIGFTVANDCF